MMIVDTGARSSRTDLGAALAEAGISPEDVGTVVNTHLHMDHCGCNDVFVNARFMAHRLEEPSVETARVEEGSKLAEGVTVLETPGHTLGSISLLVKSDVDYVICGDALPTRSNYESLAPPAVHVDRRLAVSSMERIIEAADIVVPGHDAPFKIMGKK